MMHADNSKPLVSVIIPCYNEARYLVEAIQSVLRRSYPHTGDASYQVIMSASAIKH